MGQPHLLPAVYAATSFYKNKTLSTPSIELIYHK